MVHHIGVRAALGQLIVTSLVIAGCSGGPVGDGRSGEVVTGGRGDPAGIEASVVAEGLVGPTQIASDGQGGFVVAELGGAEGEPTGRILWFDRLPGEPIVVVEGLTTPTGVAVDGDLLWVMEQRTLSVAVVDRPFGTGLDQPLVLRTVLDDMPFNGRSQGTISVVPGGGILFDTSGRVVDDVLVEGSGTLWYLSGPEAQPEVVATGFKHGYAHAHLAPDQWLVTEISDGRLDGRTPPDELVVAERGDDFGYPGCIGDRVPVVEVDPAGCEGTPPSLAVFAPHATPTGVAVTPWDRSRAWVALWNEGVVVAVPTTGDGPPPVAHEVVFDGADRPQHLVADSDRMLLTDHAAGRIVSFVEAGDP